MRRNGTSAASLPTKIPAGNPQIAGGPRQDGIQASVLPRSGRLRRGTPAVTWFWKVGTTSKPCQRIPQNPHTSLCPQTAHGTLQMLRRADESVIVGYYTSAEVLPQNERNPTNSK